MFMSLHRSHTETHPLTWRKTSIYTDKVDSHKITYSHAWTHNEIEVHTRDHTRAHVRAKTTYQHTDAKT